MLAAAKVSEAEDCAAPVVAIVDADCGARSATRCLLESEGYRIFSFASVNAFLRATLPETPACLLLDMQARGRDGLDSLRLLAARAHCPPLLIASAQARLDVAVEAMKLGAADFVQKPYAPTELLKAIESLGPPGTQPEGGEDSGLAALVDSLPRRQRQILSGIARGLQNKVIAWELKLSIRTIEFYRARLFRRLGIRSVAEAVRIAVAAGLDRADLGAALGDHSASESRPMRSANAAKSG